MLVLSRMRGQSIIINDNIIVTLYKIRGDKIQLQFKAPREVLIYRMEVYRAVKALRRKVAANEPLTSEEQTRLDKCIEAEAKRGGTLTLSRQHNDVVMIGDDIEVIVADISGDTVRLGVNAPKSITVHRLEVYEAIKRGESKTPAKSE